MYSHNGCHKIISALIFNIEEALQFCHQDVIEVFLFHMLKRLFANPEDRAFGTFPATVGAMKMDFIPYCMLIEEYVDGLYGFLIAPGETGTSQTYHNLLAVSITS